MLGGMWRRMRPVALLVAVCACVASAPAGADAAVGDLSVAQCYDSAGSQGCTQALPAVTSGPEDLVASPDGRQVYVVGGAGDIGVFNRDPSTHALTAAGCIGAGAGCVAVPNPSALDSAVHVVISGDGLSVDVLGAGQVATFDRAPGSGTLTYRSCLTTQVAATPGCTVVTSPLYSTLSSLAVSDDGHTIWVGTIAGDFDQLSRGASGSLSWVRGDESNQHLGGITTIALTGDGRGLVLSGSGYASSYRVTTGAPALVNCLSSSGSNGSCTPSTVGGQAALSPDGASVYLGDGPAGVVVLKRATDTGRLSYAGCYDSAGAGSCHHVANDSLASVNAVRVSSDGKSLYTLGTHDSGGLDLGGGLAWFARAADGTPTFAGCIEPFSAGGCAGAGHAAGLDGGRAIAIPGDGFSLYTASLGTSETGGTSAIGAFVRDTPPSCPSPPAQSVAVNTSTSIPLTCNSPAGDPPTTGTVLTPPAHEPSPTWAGAASPTPRTPVTRESTTSPSPRPTPPAPAQRSRWRSW